MIFWHEIVEKLLFTVTHGTFNIKKQIPRSKKMKNRSTNHFPDLILSHVKSSDRLRFYGFWKCKNFDCNFRALTHPHAFSKYENRVPRQKIKENRSLNCFSTMLPSSFRCSDRWYRQLCVVQDLGLPSPPGARGKGLHCEMPQGGMVELNVEDHIKHQVRTLW